MSPFEHGEVFVLDDGGEVSRNTCKDLFHYKQTTFSRKFGGVG